MKKEKMSKEMKKAYGNIIDALVAAVYVAAEESGIDVKNPEVTIKTVKRSKTRAKR
jgi:hypothetical protein